MSPDELALVQFANVLDTNNECINKINVEAWSFRHLTIIKAFNLKSEVTQFQTIERTPIEEVPIRPITAWDINITNKTNFGISVLTIPGSTSTTINNFIPSITYSSLIETNLNVIGIRVIEPGESLTTTGGLIRFLSFNKYILRISDSENFFIYYPFSLKFDQEINNDFVGKILSHCLGGFSSFRDAEEVKARFDRFK